MRLAPLIGALQSADDEAVGEAALIAYLLLERYRRESYGAELDPGLVDLLMEHIDTHLTSGEVDALRGALLQHVVDRGVDSDRSVVSALCESPTAEVFDEVSSLVELLLAEPIPERGQRQDLLDQSLTVLYREPSGAYRDLFLRVARLAVGDAADTAENVIEVRRWS